MKADYIEADPVRSSQNIIDNRDQKSIRELYEAVERAEVVIVDGDGDLIFRNPAGRIPLFNLAVIELAVRLGKQVHYINSIFADCPISGRNAEFLQHSRNTLSKCATVSLRDHTSLEHARFLAPELNARYAPDALFLWQQRVAEAAQDLPANGDLVIPFTQEKPEYFGRIRFDRPYLCLSGSSHAAFFQEEAAETYTALAVAIRDHFKMDVYLTPACRGDRYLFEVATRTSLPIIPAEVPIMTAGAILAKAQVYVTGRYHPAILASLGGTSTVFLGADSHKTHSLQDLLEYADPKTFPALPRPEDIKAIIGQIEIQLSQATGDGERIREAAKRRATEAARVADFVLEKMQPVAG
jgi:polysaccharide pyruvyl transferase WcaK-like protein